MENYTDLNRGKVFYISKFYHILDSRLYLLNVFDFSVDVVTRANQQLRPLLHGERVTLTGMVTMALRAKTPFASHAKR